MRLFDTHAHIHDAEFDGDRAEMLVRARHADVLAVLTLGVDLADSRRALALAEGEQIVLAAAGVHPHDAKDATGADLDALEALAHHPRVVAVGEIGLDFYRNLSPRDRQVAVLRRQLDTAARVSKPVSVHAREAHDAMLPLLTEWSREMGGRLPDGRPLGVMHYFSGDARLASRYVDLGFMISVHTSVTHPKSEQLRGVAREVPIEHLVVETDSPYGAPQRYRGKRNEPAYVEGAALAIAEAKSIALDAVAEATTRNALRLFGLADAAARPAIASGSAA